LTHIIDAAKAFAKYAHRHQVRKYTGESYFNHCEEVANIVLPFGTNEMVAAAYLHDTVEDCEVPIELIGSLFGDEVQSLVSDLTDVSTLTDGNRRTRKDIDLAHTAKASQDAKTIKLADLISNTKSIVQYDPDFARVYLREKERLLEVLQDGHNLLFAEANHWLLQSILELKEKGLWK
jgi:(p)ppGpp synthase/HD superfamily hydrolase